MKKEFKLEKVLDYRDRVLDQEKMKLAELNNADELLVKQMNEIEEEILLKQQERTNDTSNGMLSFAEMYDKYIKVKEKEYLQTAIKRQELQKVIEQQKLIVRKALADLKIMQKLKEKHLLEYVKYMDKKEARDIDEINVTKHRDENKL